MKILKQLLLYTFQFFRPRLHEQIRPPLIAQILDPYEVTPGEFAQINVVLFAHVNAGLCTLRVKSTIYVLLPESEISSTSI